VRIAFLGPVYPYRGGIAHYTARLAREALTLGHDVLVVNLSRQYPEALFPGTTQEDQSKRAFDVPAHRWLDTLNPLTWATTARRLLRWAPDVLVVQWWHPYFAASFGAVASAARAAGVQVVMVCHNVEPHESTPVDRALLRAAYVAPHRFVVHARSEESVLRHYRSTVPIVVHAHPVYDQFADGATTTAQQARAQLGLDGERWLLFFGLIRPYKGLDVLLDAMPAIHAATGARLAVLGECYGDADAIHAQIARLGLAPVVRLELRYASNEEVPTWMTAADAVVLPYRHATQSGVAQAAYGCGRAVISTAVGGIPDIVLDGESGLLVPPEDPSALAAAVSAFYAPGIQARLEAGVVRVRSRFTWGSLLDAVLGG
jgi:D-inositol-3-phosphate glycosyltransferase